MKIAHYVGFGPNRSGLYEAARDMLRGDLEYGHDAVMVDVGVTKDGGSREPATVGSIDDRAGFRIKTVSWQSALDADVIVAHTGIDDSWVVQSQAPMVWLLHGRPLDAFRPEQNRGRRSYSIMGEVAQWPRVRAMLTLWREHVEYWQVMMPPEKLVLIDDPPIDKQRFSPQGPRYEIPARYRGETNVLIADSWRDDVDTFEVANSTYHAAKTIPGVRVHFCAMEFPLDENGRATPTGPWTHLLDAYKQVGVLGEVFARLGDMQNHYRAMDVLLTPHVIATRTLLEPMACGVYIIGAPENRWATATANPASAKSMTTALAEAVRRIRCGEFTRETDVGKVCGLATYAARINHVYEAAVEGRPMNEVHIPMEGSNGNTSEESLRRDYAACVGCAH